MEGPGLTGGFTLEMGGGRGAGQAGAIVMPFFFG